VQRSTDFYTNHFGFQKAAEFGNRVGLHKGVLLLVLTSPPKPAQAIPDDRFDENRLGLDHVSLYVGSPGDVRFSRAYGQRPQSSLWVELMSLEAFVRQQVCG
jgi:catechol 2,3-dioxygenase-like lactoylglutathione lyase family enzyme